MPFINRYRLPISLYSPQFIDEQEKFRKANGSTVVLSNIVRKQYDVRTDYMPEKWHERLKIAIAHDNVTIEAEKYLGGVTQEGGYEINWPDFLNYPLAPAAFKVEVNGFNARNSNCGTCAEYSQVVTEDDDIGEIGEDETVIVPILYNDSICCSPFEISLVLFNNLFLDSCDIVGNTLVIHSKTGIPTMTGVTLATYRVTCENGMYDEANVIADVQGTVDVCPVVVNLQVDTITATTAEASWNALPGNCGYNWALYLASDLGTPIQSGSQLGVSVDLEGLTPATNYVFFVQRDCCDGDLSDFRTKSFTTNPPSEAEICGQYQIEFIDGCGYGVNYIDFQYLDCNSTFVDIQIFSSPALICMHQSSPGSPTFYSVIAYNQLGPEPCELPYTLNVTYLGEC